MYILMAIFENIEKDICREYSIINDIVSMYYVFIEGLYLKIRARWFCQ